MSLSNPRIIFGVYSISPYHRDTKLPYGILKVVGSAHLALSSSIDELFGGANRFSWAAEAKQIKTELTAKVKAYPGFLFQLFLGASVTDTGVDSSGTVSALVNAKGTSAFNSTTGIASIAVKSAAKADLKFGKYTLSVLTSTTVALYLQSDIDIKRGTAESYLDDTLSVVATLTIVASTGTDITGFGLTLTGGSGTIGMTVGDTCTFEVKPLSTSSSLIVVGSNPTDLPAFGAIMLAQKRATGEMFEIDAHNVIGVGLPIPLAEFAYSEAELKATCVYDSVLDRVFTIRHILPS